MRYVALLGWSFSTSQIILAGELNRVLAPGVSYCKSRRFVVISNGIEVQELRA